MGKGRGGEGDGRGQGSWVVLGVSLARGRQQWGIWGGDLHTLTFLEHPADGEAEHRFLKGKSPGAQSPPAPPTHLRLPGPARGRKQALTVWNHVSTTKELKSC